MQKVIVIVGWCVRLCLFSGSLKSNGVILDEMVQRLGSTHSMVGWAFALQQGASYISCPFASILLRVFTKRQLAVLGSCLVGISYVYCGLCVHSLWQLFFAFIVSGAGFGIHMLAGYLNFVEHFHDNLPTMISATSLFNFVGIAVLPVVLQYFKTSYGLSQGLVLFGGLLGNLIVSAFAVTIPARSVQQDKKSNTSEADESKTCPYTEREMKSEEGNEEGCLRNLFRSLRALFKHDNVATVMALEGLMYYILVSWGLFLVSVGTCAGLRPEQAVLLSTLGGIGGFLGQLMAVGLFHINKMNAYTSSMIPIFCNALSLLCCSLVADFYLMLMFTFITGFCIGLNSSGLFGLLPTMVCKYHYKQAFVILSVIEGIMMQLGGLVSGLINDLMGSASYVFLFNSMLSVAGLPFVCKWACTIRLEEKSER